MTMRIPGYWMNETSGVLEPAVKAYLNGDVMDGAQLAAMRAYLNQWMDGPWMAGPEDGNAIELLRQAIDGLTNWQKLHDWFSVALDFGIDPL
jgi:hypothetical protein